MINRSGHTNEKILNNTNIYHDIQYRVVRIYSKQNGTFHVEFQQTRRRFT